MNRVLIFPNTHTLSHLARALAVADWLDGAGWESHLGVSALRLEWAARFHSRCHVVSELWEPSGTPHPCVKWFHDAKHVTRCIDSQERLIRSISPSLIVGIFDFPSAVSAGNIPRLSINGGCMLPFYPGVLGYDATPSSQQTLQKTVLDRFWAFAGRAFNTALCDHRQEPVASVLDLLVGDVNLIYEIDEICRLPSLSPNYHMVGPIAWDGWEVMGECVSPWRRDDSKRTVYLNCGSLARNGRVRTRIMEACLRQCDRLLVSTGLNGGGDVKSDRVQIRPFLSPAGATAVADVVVCTGGVGACYTNLLHGVPSLVVPMQPEQETNGINLERAGCGRVLRANLVFLGDPRQYEESLDYGYLEETLHEMLATQDLEQGCEQVRERLLKCRTREAVIDLAGSLQ